jgi:hypothetical protein
VFTGNDTPLTVSRKLDELYGPAEYVKAKLRKFNPFSKHGTVGRPGYGRLHPGGGRADNKVGADRWDPDNERQHRALERMRAMKRTPGEVDGETVLDGVKASDVFDKVDPRRAELTAAAEGKTRTPTLVNPRDLIATQELLNRRSIAATIHATDPDGAPSWKRPGYDPEVVRQGGKLLVIDGHHRVAGALLNDLDEVQVNLIDLDGLAKFNKHGSKDRPGYGRLHPGNVGSATAEDASHADVKPVKVGGDIVLAAKLLAEGKRVELDQPKQVATLLDELARQVAIMEAKGEKAPNYNLCGVSVRGTNLFCQGAKVGSRVEMPQLAGIPKPGSKAAKLNGGKNVDLTQRFVEHLKAKGYSISEDDEAAANMRATQAELNGVKVGGMLRSLREGKSLGDLRTIVTRDDYILDGHHRWAAEVTHDLIDNRVGDSRLPVTRVDTDIGTLLYEAHAFTDEWGMGAKDISKALDGCDCRGCSDTGGTMSLFDINKHGTVGRPSYARLHPGGGHAGNPDNIVPGRITSGPNGEPLRSRPLSSEQLKHVRQTLNLSSITPDTMQRIADEVGALKGPRREALKTRIEKKFKRFRGKGEDALLLAKAYAYRALDRMAGANRTGDDPTIVYAAADDIDWSIPPEVMAELLDEIAAFLDEESTEKASTRFVLTGIGSWGHSRLAAAGLVVQKGNTRVLIDGPPSDLEGVQAWLVTSSEALPHVNRLMHKAGVQPYMGSLHVEGLDVEPHQVRLGAGSAFGYLIKTDGRRVVWAPRFSEFPRWARGADLMFADGGGWTPEPFGDHASVQEVSKQARKHGVRKLVFGHILAPTIRAMGKGLRPSYGDIGEPGNIYIARRATFARPGLRDGSSALPPFPLT